MTSVRTTKLKNGLTVLTNPMPDLESVSMGIYIATGARIENERLNGIAHLTEHMLFKGTQKRNAKQIVEEIESVGGHINAYTSREATVYHCKTLKEDYLVSLDVISDMVMNSIFDEKELEQERKVVVQEIAQNFDTPDDAVFDDFQKALYGDHPLGRPILGTKETVMGISRQDLVDYTQKFYNLDNMYLCCAGRINEDTFLKQAEEYLAPMHKASFDKPVGANYQGGEIKTFRDIEQLHLLLGFPGISYLSEDYYAYQIMSLILGGGMSSRLFQEIREKRGLAYSIYSFNANYRDTGMMGIYAALDATFAGEIVPVIREEIEKMKTTITDFEIERAKKLYKASLLLSQESSMSRCEKMGHHQMIYGRVMSVEEQVKKIDAVSRQMILACIDALFLQGSPTLAALGPRQAIEQEKLSVAYLK